MKLQPLTKAASHYSSYWGILAVYFVTLFSQPTIAATIAAPVVAALLLLSGVSQAANVQATKNKAEHYVPEMDKAGKE
jgi:hypothetical protein